MKGALDITLKDLRLLSRDKRAIAVLVALPLAFIAIIGLSTGRLLSQRGENHSVEIAIVNRDTGEISPEVIAAIARHDNFGVEEFTDRERAYEALDRGRVVVVLEIDESFQEKVDELGIRDIISPKNGKLAAGPSVLGVTISTKPSLQKPGSMVAGIIFADTLQAITPHVAKKNNYARQQIRVAERMAEGAPAVEFHGLTLIDQQKDTSSVVYENLVPSYTVLFVFFLVNIMARSFISERELGTLRRLKLAPLSPTAILVGKNLPFYVLSLVQTSLLFACGRVLFGMSWGAQPLLLLPVIACTSLAATALGLMVATLIRTDAQVSAYANSMVLLLAGISGCFMPREWLPELMQDISLGTPHAWALIAYDELLTHRHIQLPIVAKSCGMLLAFAGVFFAIGWQRFRTVGE